MQAGKHTHTWTQNCHMLGDVWIRPVPQTFRNDPSGIIYEPVPSPSPPILHTLPLCRCLRCRPYILPRSQDPELLREPERVPGARGGGEPPKWPLLLFFALALGGPYLIWRLLSAGVGPTADGAADGALEPVQARARYDFEGRNPDELSFRAGDMLTVYPPDSHPDHTRWLMASLHGRSGYAPPKYLPCRPAYNMAFCSPVRHPVLPAELPTGLCARAGFPAECSTLLISPLRPLRRLVPGNYLRLVGQHPSPVPSPPLLGVAPALTADQGRPRHAHPDSHVWSRATLYDATLLPQGIPLPL